ncbi:hypothetical protein IscW_ISCW000974 [Ixodes scapularis]|uniref:Uncharacterized protein n=1 Tax=Ixodes scapularis TaxID=6945 RepID=B7P6Q9_IXOSC|nr:hypothetical protein IscW_ISCW000974 [Ixodes scapularis]|eukprot:XP_002409115.1 hypothetical protein IscW_ISCW000974 [Ixodes scapularis]
MKLRVSAQTSARQAGTKRVDSFVVTAANKKKHTHWSSLVHTVLHYLPLHFVVQFFRFSSRSKRGKRSPEWGIAHALIASTAAALRDAIKVNAQCQPTTRHTSQTMVEAHDPSSPKQR